MSALRALRQLTSASCRAVARPSAHGARTLGLSARAVPRMTLPATRMLSTTPSCFSAGSSDVVFAQKLAEELKYEKESVETEEPEFLKKFKEQGIWTLEDIAGNDEVTLSRQFGNETIRVMFSIADFQQPESETAEYQEDAQEGEEGSGNELPIRVSFSVTKDTAKGALNIDTVCQEGAFLVDNISFYGDATLATDLTAEADWKRRGVYIGPSFDTLDVAVQEEFERWLHERGVNESLATFVWEFAEHKEQKEYVKWLENVKGFVEA